MENERLMKQTSLEEFVDLASNGTFVPVCKEIMADLLTPVSAFLKIAEDSDNAFLLESVDGGEQVARYSFLGKDPFLIVRSRKGQTIVEHAGVISKQPESFMSTLRQLMTKYRSPPMSELPRFTGGAVGYLGYDSVPWFEASLQEAWTRQASLDNESDGDDEAAFMLFDTVLAFDHVAHRILIIANALVSKDDDLPTLYKFACAKMKFLERELERTLSQSESLKKVKLEITSNLSQKSFESSVKTAQSHIFEGEIFQVVLSRRLQTVLSADPFTVYRALRHINPSPYMYFMKMGRTVIVGASPEMLVRVENKKVETHPIAGTRPRGMDVWEDERLGEELKADEKERAEHVMLVDLGRNDLGRVCEYGTVRVPQFMRLERYSHVMHLVSKVEGRLADGKDQLDALAACFPAGTVSGAPKVRAMELITQLEPTRRGIYAGAIGYLDFAGNLDCCIGIRTITIRDGRASIQSGAGIVADSVPESEFKETEDKAKAMLRAIEMAHRNLI
jgi:anthranilate synthase component 1